MIQLASLALLARDTNVVSLCGTKPIDREQTGGSPGVNRAKQSQTWERWGIWRKAGVACGVPLPQSGSYQTKPTWGRQPWELRSEGRESALVGGEMAGVGGFAKQSQLVVSGLVAVDRRKTMGMSVRNKANPGRGKVCTAHPTAPALRTERPVATVLPARVPGLIVRNKANWRRQGNRACRTGLLRQRAGHSKIVGTKKAGSEGLLKAIGNGKGVFRP